MFNITVNLKRLLKKVWIILGIVILGFLVIKFSKNIFSNISCLINEEYAKIIEFEISFSNYEKISLEKGVQKILSSELVTVANSELIEDYSGSNVEKNTGEELQEDSQETINDKQALEANADVEDNNIDYKNLKTEVLSDKNLKETYNAEYQGVKIKNESSYTLTEDMLKPDVEYTNKNDILIFHTHTPINFFVNIIKFQFLLLTNYCDKIC